MEHPSEEDIIYIRGKINVLKDEIESYQTFLSVNKLPEAADPAFDKVFTTRKKVFDGLSDMEKKYMDLSNITSYFNYVKAKEAEREENTKKKTRKGTVNTGVADRIRAIKEKNS